MSIIMAAAIAISVSIDALLVSFAYGCKKIKIPWVSALIISLVCTAAIGVAYVAGSFLVGVIPDWAVGFISFVILFAIGVSKLFDSLVKTLIGRYVSREINLSIFDFKFVLHVYAKPEAADMDTSKSISAKEAVVLATSLSLDGLGVGLSAAMVGIGGFTLTGVVFVIGFAAIVAGGVIGHRLATRFKANISWVAGVILIGVAILQLL